MIIWRENYLTIFFYSFFLLSFDDDDCAHFVNDFFSFDMCECSLTCLASFSSFLSLKKKNGWFPFTAKRELLHFISFFKVRSNHFNNIRRQLWKCRTIIIQITPCIEWHCASRTTRIRKKHVFEVNLWRNKKKIGVRSSLKWISCFVG